ncbi:MAG TPA: type II 3-dehydroquinate dehydratase [Dehalococcoidia bacterium]|nr:type II 3-dehydroquinate dehydratase [Dehalococcoidia bacterium]
MVKILILNGPNLNVLGRRSPGHYGTKTLDEINHALTVQAQGLKVDVDFFQSNLEGEIVTCIQEHWGDIQGIIINPGALTMYGYSLKDALIDASVPVIEVHLSNIHAREEFRRHSVISDVARGQIAGFGWRSYTAALDIIAEIAQEN